MNNIGEIMSKVPKLILGEELREKLLYLPEYEESIINESEAVRLMNLEQLYEIYIPSNMSMEIYSKIYLAMVRSLQKKNNKIATIQQNINYKRICQNETRGIIGGSDSFLITGLSGIGKSSAIIKAMELASNNEIIEIEKPLQKIIPCLVVQCPFDCSVKGLLYEILRKVDEILGSCFYKSATKSGATIDMMIGSISQVALNHIGLLVVDEIQNVVNHKGGKNLVAMLTQLINNSGISICMVGTPESEIFFEKVDYLARRALGLKYTDASYNDYFVEFCETVFSFQYVRNRTEITEEIIDWLYEHSGGIISNVITLIHDAQEIAIITGRETLDLVSLEAAYKERMSTLHKHINPSVVKVKKTSKVKKERLKVEVNSIQEESDFSIVDLAVRAKKEEVDIVELLGSYIQISEVKVG